MSVVVIKYNAGNVESVLHALHRTGVEAQLSDNLQEISSATRVIFPGVGEASSAMRYIEERGLHTILPTLRQPVLGICLGMQLMCEFSEENDVDCLGIFPARLSRFRETGIKVPHMGWNQITSLRGPLFAEVSEGEHVYFAHSYFVASHSDSIASCFHGEEFTAALQKDNFYGVQFHPEKSAAVGERILRNFLAL